jgi:hypothetical protein
VRLDLLAPSTIHSHTNTIQYHIHCTNTPCMGNNEIEIIKKREENERKICSKRCSASIVLMASRYAGRLVDCRASLFSFNQPLAYLFICFHFLKYISFCLSHSLLFNASFFFSFFLSHTLSLFLTLSI